jgi:hypothetical protein
MTAVPNFPPAPVGQQGPPARAAASHAASRAGHCRATPACPQHAQEQNTRPVP